MKELIINNVEDRNLIFLIEDGKIVEYYEDNKETKNLDGNKIGRASCRERV